MAKISFPEHMRNAQAALEVLSAECKKYDPKGFDWQVDIQLSVYEEYGQVFFILRARRLKGSSTWIYPGSGEGAEHLEDAAIALLHKIAGTEEAPF